MLIARSLHQSFTSFRHVAVLPSPPAVLDAFDSAHRTLAEHFSDLLLAIAVYPERHDGPGPAVHSGQILADAQLADHDIGRVGGGVELPRGVAGISGVLGAPPPAFRTVPAELPGEDCQARPHEVGGQARAAVGPP